MHTDLPGRVDVPHACLEKKTVHLRYVSALGRDELLQTGQLAAMHMHARETYDALSHERELGLANFGRRLLERSSQSVQRPFISTSAVIHVR